MENKIERKGWVVLSNAKKAHYFIDGRSLCKQYLYLGSCYEDNNHESPDNCKKCMAERNKRYPEVKVST